MFVFTIVSKSFGVSNKEAKRLLESGSIRVGENVIDSKNAAIVRLGDQLVAYEKYCNYWIIYPFNMQGVYICSEIDLKTLEDPFEYEFLLSKGSKNKVLVKIIS